MNNVPLTNIEKFIPLTDNSDAFKSGNNVIEIFESNHYVYKDKSVNEFSFHYRWELNNNEDEGIIIEYPNDFFKDKNTYNDNKDSFTQYYRKIK